MRTVLQAPKRTSLSTCARRSLSVPPAEVVTLGLWRSGWNTRGHAILRAEGQPTQASVKLAEKRAIERREDDEPSLQLNEPGRPKQPCQSAGAQQYRVFVERAASYDPTV